MAAHAASASEIWQSDADHVQLLFSVVQIPPGLDEFDLARMCAECWPHIRILVTSDQTGPERGQLLEGEIFIGRPVNLEVEHARIQDLSPDEMEPEPL